MRSSRLSRTFDASAHSQPQEFELPRRGLDPENYGNESLRRTKALHILNGTGDIEAVRVLLGHTKIGSTARYLRIAKRSDPIAISLAFNI